jgi:cephalosporin-C deacetylase-like acetyl esterase
MQARGRMKQFDWRVSRLVGLSVLTLVQCAASAGAETFTPYAPGAVPQTVTDLWKDYDARKEPLDVEVVKEWQADGVVSRYVLFTVGTFKGSQARIAAYYSFPANGKKNAAFVWSHGGGQRAERGRGVYFASQGYATVDINWLGRPLEEGIEVNTDWGKVDPTQGPQFYGKALRKGWKRSLLPDDYSIDSVVSPRNANWFLLAVAARRAITFLEQQPEVDPERIGFSGFSMGGMITALTAIDSRLKAVVPFVGGTGFKYIDFPGVERSSLRVHFQPEELELYKATIDPVSYWPLVKCPTCFISSSNDFHSAFDRIYQSMALLQHADWRVTTNIHHNHGPGPEQWVLLNLWFDQYLKGIDQQIPVTPPSTFTMEANRATFTVSPENPERLVETEVYYSYDSNARMRFWKRAETVRVGAASSVDLPVYGDLPLYVFALCRYRLKDIRQLERGETKTFVLNSKEQVWLPEFVDRRSLAKLAKAGDVFEDFANGSRDWGTRDGRSLTTYKFQDPSLDRGHDRKLAFMIDPHGKRLVLRLRAESKFLAPTDNQGSFTLTKQVSGNGPQEVVIAREDFEGPDGKTLEWAKIGTLQVTLVDVQGKTTLELATASGQEYLRAIRLID